jgi:DNA-binding winged helix-turn-helix (wHTH) protein
MKIRFGRFTLDVDARQLSRGDTPLHLSPKAFDLLTMLVEQRPAVVEKAALRQRLWPDVHVVDAALTNLIAEVRAALKEGTAETTFLRTVHGIGYAFASEEIAQSGGAEPSPTPFWLVWNDRPIVLMPGEHVVGRDAACDVWVDADGVSRRHARLRVRADAPDRVVTIEDLGSTNGTYVRGRKVTSETRLENGDRIGMGRATLVFRAWKPADGPTKRVKAPGRTPR